MVYAPTASVVAGVKLWVQVMVRGAALQLGLPAKLPAAADLNMRPPVGATPLPVQVRVPVICVAVPCPSPLRAGLIFVTATVGVWGLTSFPNEALVAVWLGSPL